MCKYLFLNFCPPPFMQQLLVGNDRARQLNGPPHATRPQNQNDPSHAPYHLNEHLKQHQPQQHHLQPAPHAPHYSASVLGLKEHAATTLNAVNLQHQNIQSSAVPAAVEPGAKPTSNQQQAQEQLPTARGMPSTSNAPAQARNHLAAPVALMAPPPVVCMSFCVYACMCTCV